MWAEGMVGGTDLVAGEGEDALGLLPHDLTCSAWRQGAPAPTEPRRRGCRVAAVALGVRVV